MALKIGEDQPVQMPMKTVISFIVIVALGTMGYFQIVERLNIADTKINNGATLKPKFLSKFNHYKGLIYLKRYQKNIESPDSFGFLSIATNSFFEDSENPGV